MSVRKTDRIKAKYNTSCFVGPPLYWWGGLLVCRLLRRAVPAAHGPVAGLMQRVSDFGEALHSNLQELLSRPGEDEMVNQLAGPPAIEEVLRRRRARSRSLSPGTGGVSDRRSRGSGLLQPGRGTLGQPDLR